MVSLLSTFHAYAEPRKCASGYATLVRLSVTDSISVLFRQRNDKDNLIRGIARALLFPATSILNTDLLVACIFTRARACDMSYSSLIITAADEFVHV